MLGLEQFEIGHDRGSSHGRSRVIRKAYFEDPRYVPLLHRAYELWRELEKETGVKLLHLVGCLNMGPPGHESIRGVLSSVREHGLAHEVVSAEEIRGRWPALRPNEGDIGLYEPEAGFLVPEECVRLQAEQARRQGAVIRVGERLLRWSADSRTVAVETDRGRYAAERLVITAGPWLPEVLSELEVPVSVERQVQLWFEPKGSPGGASVALAAGRMPVFIHFLGDRSYYGIPPRGNEGIKVARHHGGEITTAAAIDRAVRPQDEADVRGYLRRHLPEADGRLMDAKVCMYTNTPDHHFIIDFHPAHPNVVIAGGFSGHGFKFSAVVGEILADLAVEGSTSQPIDLFALMRFVG